MAKLSRSIIGMFKYMITITWISIIMTILRHLNWEDDSGVMVFYTSAKILSFILRQSVLRWSNGVIRSVKILSIIWRLQILEWWRKPSTWRKLLTFGKGIDKLAHTKICLIVIQTSAVRDAVTSKSIFKRPLRHVLCSSIDSFIGWANLAQVRVHQCIDLNSAPDWSILNKFELDNH